MGRFLSARARRNATAHTLRRQLCETCPGQTRASPSSLTFSFQIRGILSKTTFFNRQALHLRPDPARVVVRPFKPATEPRDLNPTDKTRANHIVERVLALDPAAVATQLAEVLENFLGRHRNLIQTFEARADEMEKAFAVHTPFTQDQR